MLLIIKNEKLFANYTGIIKDEMEVLVIIIEKR